MTPSASLPRTAVLPGELLELGLYFIFEVVEGRGAGAWCRQPLNVLYIESVSTHDRGRSWARGLGSC